MAVPYSAFIRRIIFFVEIMCLWKISSSQHSRSKEKKFYEAEDEMVSEGTTTALSTMLAHSPVDPKEGR